MEKVLPEIIENSSPEELKSMSQTFIKLDGTPSKMTTYTNLPVQQNDVNNSNSSTDSTRTVSALPAIIVSAGSATENASSYVMHHSLTTTTSLVPSIATCSMLYSLTTSKYVNVVSEQSTGPTNSNGAGGRYNNAPAGRYVTYGYHTVTFPAGYVIPSQTYYSTSNTVTH